MKDLLRPLLANPIFVLLIAAVAVIYILLLFQILKRKEASSFFDKAFIFVYLLIVSGVTIFPLSSLQPQLIYRGLAIEKSFTAMSVVFPITVYACLFFVGSRSFRNIGRSIKAVIKHDYCFGLLLLLPILSTLWTKTPLTTLFASFLFTTATVVAIHLGLNHSLQKLCDLIRWNMTFSICASILVSKLIPSIGVATKGWQGIFGHPNALASIAALNVTLWFLRGIYEPKQRIKSVIFILLSLVCLKFANSGGGIVSLIVLTAVTVVTVLIKRLKSKQAFVAIILLLIFSVLSYTIFTSNIGIILSSLGKDPSLTGRGDFWPALLSAISERLILGYGYAGYWQPWLGTEDPSLPVSNGLGFDLESAHNGFIGLALELGLTGLLLFLISLIRTIFQSVSFMINSKDPESSLPLVFIVFLIISNVSEERLISFFGFSNVWIYYVWMVTFFAKNSIQLHDSHGFRFNTRIFPIR